MIQTSGILILVIFTCIGILLLTKALRSRRLCKKAEKWSSTTATVLESSTEEDPGRNAMGQLNTSYILYVDYEYNVDGKQYRGNRVVFGRPAFEFITASNYLEQYAVGKEVPVYYDPANPADCVLAPNTKVGMLSLIPGIFFIASGILVGSISIFL